MILEDFGFVEVYKCNAKVETIILKVRAKY